MNYEHTFKKVKNHYYRLVIQSVLTSMIGITILLVIIIGRSLFGFLIWIIAYSVVIFVLFISFRETQKHIVYYTMNNDHLKLQFFKATSLSVHQSEISLIRRSHRRILLYSGSTFIGFIWYGYLTKHDQKTIQEFFNEVNFPDSEVQYAVF